MDALCSSSLRVLVDLQVIIQGFHPTARWKLRHVPGPSPLWVFGNTLEVRHYDFLLFLAWDAWAKKYGKVFKWFWGPQPVITVRGKSRLVAAQHHHPTYVAAVASRIGPA